MLLIVRLLVLFVCVVAFAGFIDAALLGRIESAFLCAMLGVAVAAFGSLIEPD